MGLQNCLHYGGGAGAGYTWVKATWFFFLKVVKPLEMLQEQNNQQPRTLYLDSWTADILG